MRDYIAIAKKYAKNALGDTKREKYGKWIQLAAKRFIVDLDRASDKSCPFIFNKDEAIQACAFIENMPHVEGKWDSSTIVLHPALS